MVYSVQVYYVLNVTDMRAREVCEFHRQCDAPANRSQSNQALTLKKVKIERPEVDSSQPRRSKQEMLRVAHITDVHYDPKYAPVSLQPSHWCHYVDLILRVHMIRHV